MTLLTRTLFSVALVASSTLASTAFAHGAFKCDVPSKEWKLREDLEDKLKEEGWDVRKIKIDNGCYEVYGFDKKGRKREAYFNPKTFELVGDVQQ
ncbi:PepSY domain-containing protein [Aquabacterium sp.]|uniref:PepSY domain-containing protein n=1 Tax=Aquabacterium sp. TaxID=1872578 RepID=UPI0035B3132A